MAPASARSLATNIVRKAVLAASDTPQATDPLALDPGHMRLYRYYAPSLQPGLYGIEAKQTVKASGIAGQADSTLSIFNYEASQATNLATDPNNPNAPTLLQQFNVIAPRFSIDPKVVNSVYPPPGHADDGSVLPHIVFNDPHLPWERSVFIQMEGVEFNKPTPTQPTPQDGPPKLTVPHLGSSNTIPAPAAINVAPSSSVSASSPLQPPPFISEAPLSSSASSVPSTGDTFVPEMAGRKAYVPPWIGLAVFDIEELTLTPEQEKSLGIPLHVTPPVPSNSANSNQVGSVSGKVSAPGAYPMTVGEYFTKVSSHLNFDPIYKDDPAGLAALKSSTETTSIIFPTMYKAKRIFTPAIQYLHLAHVRETDVEGLPDAGTSPRALFSVCISRRTGPVIYGSPPKPVPKTQVVHLISLEGVDLTTIPADYAQRIGLVSLYSWTYLSVPPNPINFVDVMRNLGTTMQMLKPPQGPLDNLRDSVASQSTADLKTAAQQLYDRLNQGYTVSRWRTAVGQESVAYTRGPLTPLPTPWKPSVANDWPGSSNTGKDYQILDSDLGVMDLSFSSAWQLGKLLAISDKRFNSALLRFRSLVHQAAVSSTNMQISGLAPKTAIVGNVASSISELEASSDGTRTPLRLVLPTSNQGAVPPPITHPDVAPIFNNNLVRIIGAQVAAGQSLYRGFGLGKANNPDWEVIHNWISDKLFLGGIPAQYLFPDPSFLPSEALRFFYIDNAWIDCLIDGALSVANHLEPVDDKIRRRIKDVYNVHLANNIDPAPIKPPVPRYGFVLRSQLIKVMPDLKVTVTCGKVTGTPPNTTTVEDTTRKPLVRLTRLDEFTIFALLDCYPEEIMRIMFIQPPHQQRYIAAQAGLDSQPDFELIQLYNINAPKTTNWPNLSPPSRYPSRDDMNNWYDSSSRCLDTISMARDIEPALVQPDTGLGGFASQAADSVILALELNDRSYQLTILPPQGNASPLPTVPFTRQLWVGTDIDDPTDPVPSAKPVIINIPIPPVIIQPPASQPVSAPPGTVHPDVLPVVNLPKPVSVNLTATNLVLQHTDAKAVATALPEQVPTLTAKALSPLYQLAIHPAYRGAAPRPSVADDGTKTYSAVDYLPTATTRPFDLIVSVQRARFILLLNAHPLVGLTVQIATTNTSTTAAGAAEPLLLLPTSKTGILDARMIQNKRLLPFLSMADATPPSPGQGTLAIKLTPRTSADTSVALSQVVDCGFRLSGAHIAPVMNPVNLKIVGQTTPASRGLCSIKLVETYLLPDGTTADAVSTWDVIKRQGGDVDLAGNQV
jgi:hypothetical protein